MKQIASLILGIIIVQMGFAQSPIFYRAEHLLEKYQGGKIKIDDRTVETVLQDLFPGDSPDKVVAKLNRNPFLLNMVEFQAAAGFKDLSAVASKIGGLDVTKFANVLADIMIDRAKQELTVAFFNRFKTFAKENSEFQVLFPKTTDNLNGLLAYTYPQMLPALRTGFFDDLKQITYRLDDLIDLPRYRSLLKDFPEVRMAIRSIRIVHELETGASNAADVINDFSKFEEWKSKKVQDDWKDKEVNMYNVGSSLKVAALFSESIRNDTLISGTKDVWVPAEEVKNLFQDPIFFNIYLGLIYQQSVAQSIHFYKSAKDSISFATILGEQKDDLFLFQNKLKEYFDLAAIVNNSYKDLKSKIEKKEKPDNEDLYNYINTSITVIEYGFGIVKIFHKEAVPISDEYLAVARKSNELFKCIYTKKYSQAITNTIEIFTTLADLINPQLSNIKVIKSNDMVKNYKGKSDDEVRRLKNGSGSGNTFLAAVSGEKIDVVANTNPTGAVKELSQYRGLEHLTAFLEKVKPYALFIANVVEADDESDIKAALENAILPVGSSGIKKNAKGVFGNLSVQSYLGAYYSTSVSSNAASLGTWTDKWGVTAPIGISLTPGFTSWGRGGSLSIFGTLLDLGAIVDYRLRRDSTINADGTTNKNAVSRDYKIELGQIFSPGGYLVYGFPWNIPLSLGFGAQYGPGLSKINVDNTTTINSPSWRWNAFLSVDIPFFTLKHKNKSN